MTFINAWKFIRPCLNIFARFYRIYSRHIEVYFWLWNLFSPFMNLFRLPRIYFQPLKILLNLREFFGGVFQKDAVLIFEFLRYIWKSWNMKRGTIIHRRTANIFEHVIIITAMWIPCFDVINTCEYHRCPPNKIPQPPRSGRQHPEPDSIICAKIGWAEQNKCKVGRNK